MHKLDALDLELKKRVAAIPGGERVTNCFLCGTCTAGCPISDLHGEFSPRQMMRQILLGISNVVESPELWQCLQCHVCVAHCPQDVRPADVIRALRQLAIEEGCASRELAATVEGLDEQLRRDRIAKIKELTAK